MALIEDIYDVPKSCLVDYVVPKKAVFEAANSNTSEKRVFTDLIKRIKWCYKFSEDNLRVSPYLDDVRDYTEVEVISIELKYDNVHKIGVGKFKEDSEIDDIAKTVMRFIPYPIILTAQYENELKFYGAHIRESKADYDKIVIDDQILSTNWMDIDNLSEIEDDFISKIQLDNLDKTDFYDFYDDYITAIIQHDGAMAVGGTVDLPVEEIERINSEISVLERKIREIEKEIDEETNFNRKVELNIDANKFKVEKENLIKKLKGN